MWTILSGHRLANCNIEEDIMSDNLERFDRRLQNRALQDHELDVVAGGFLHLFTSSSIKAVGEALSTMARKA